MSSFYGSGGGITQGGGGDILAEKMYICGANEYDPTLGLPSIANPEQGMFYLVPATNGEENNLFNQFIYKDEKWEKFGSGGLKFSDLVVIAGTGTGSAMTKNGNTASGVNSFAEGGKLNFSTKVIDDKSYTEPGAYGDYSHSEGLNTLAIGYSSHVEGYGTIASGYDSHAEGGGTTASGNTSHAEGGGVTASGNNSHAEGGGSKASGNCSHAEGTGTTAKGQSSHAEGTGTTAEGQSSHAEGASSNFSTKVINGTSYTRAGAYGDYSHSEGLNTLAIGNYSHAEGAGTIASNNHSHAEGGGTTASGEESHAEGGGVTASGNHSHAEGSGTTASGNNSHAEGGGTTASGNTSHAEGGGITAVGTCSHAEGASSNFSTKTINDKSYTRAGSYGVYSHSEGLNTLAIGDSSHAEGSDTTASGHYSHAEGVSTTTSGNSSHAEGGQTTASGSYSHAEGSGTTASKIAAHAEGGSTMASGNNSHAEGNNTTASGHYSHAEGGGASASGVSSHAEGTGTTAEGQSSHAEGASSNFSTKVINGTSYTRAGAYGDYSHSEGLNTLAIGNYSHAEGGGTTASGQNSHAEGGNTTASGYSSHVEGNGTTASGYYSYASGFYTVANHQSQHVFGEYNVEDPSTATANNRGNYVEIVGNGTNKTKSNARTLDWDGNEILAGKLTVGSSPTDNMDVATKQYVDQHSGGSAGLQNLVDGSATGSVRGINTVAEDNNYTMGLRAVAEGNSTKAFGDNSHAEGSGTTASGNSAHAEGGDITAVGTCSHAEGASSNFSTKVIDDKSYTEPGAYGDYSHSEGLNTLAIGYSSHVEGYGTIASGDDSHAEGNITTASGIGAHAEGGQTTASGSYSHASGFHTMANHKSQHVFGEYNVEDSSTTLPTARGNYVEIIGNGTANSSRSNARTLDWNGNEVLAGKITVGSNPTGNMDVTTKGYVDNEINNLESKNLITNETKGILLNILKHLAFTDSLGEDLYESLYDSLYPDNMTSYQLLQDSDFMENRGFSNFTVTDGNIVYDASNTAQYSVGMLDIGVDKIKIDIDDDNNFSPGAWTVFGKVDGNTYYATNGDLTNPKLYILKYNTSTSSFSATEDNTIATLTQGEGSVNTSKIIIKQSNGLFQLYNSTMELIYSITNSNCIGFWLGNTMNNGSFWNNVRIRYGLRPVTMEDIVEQRTVPITIDENGTIAPNYSNGAAWLFTFSERITEIRFLYSLGYIARNYCLIYKKVDDNYYYGTNGDACFIYRRSSNSTTGTEVFGINSLSNENDITRINEDKKDLRVGADYYVTATLKDNKIKISNPFGYEMIINDANCLGLWAQSQLAEFKYIRVREEDV